MNPVHVNEILAEIDAEISKLQQARALLGGEATPKQTRSKNKATTTTIAPKKRKLTPEGRKRIAEAMKRRWAERKKLAAKSVK
jgi:putative heme iron utilization protein